MEREIKYLTLSQLQSLSWLAHGFGLAGFGPEHLQTDSLLSSFTPIEMNQLHSDRVFFLNRAPEMKLSGDGLITTATGLLLIIKTADCLPVLIIDEVNRVVAAVHCGWRSTSQRIVEKTVSIMQEKAGSQPEALKVALGPCIESTCYEVGLEVYENFQRSGFDLQKIFSPARPRDKFLLDLRKANRWLLVENLGLREENIYDLNLCTFCQPHLYSYRRDRQKDNRLINFVGLKNII